MRMKVTMLEQFYKEFRYYSFEEYLDGDTFIHLLVLAFQSQNRLPNRWRFYDFGIFNEMISKFSILPPGQQDEHYANTSVEKSREFVDWKKILTVFTLLMAPLPSDDSLNDYSTALLSLGPSISNPDVFSDIPAWFDTFEIRTENPVAAPVHHSDASEDEDDEESRNSDPERLVKIKLLLFKIHQSNTRVLKVEEYIKSIREITEMANGFQNFH